MYKIEKTFNLQRFVVKPFSITNKYIITKVEHIETLHQEFLELMPEVIDDYIEAESYYMFLNNTSWAISETKEKFLSVLSFVENSDPLKKEKINAINLCWSEFEPFLKASLEAKKLAFFFKRQ
ncbi:MAG: hypothetical protein AAF298_19125 [Cyanobacteria bacterium P01_A01_bin.40]